MLIPHKLNINHQIILMYPKFLRFHLTQMNLMFHLTQMNLRFH
jgi:hypothetical protein